jgi:RNA polymerase sigma-70 factor (ECF subfamily)
MTAPTPDPAALADLLRQATAGESAALAELLQRYERRVRLAARSLLRPPLQHLLDSFDLVQSVHRALLPGLRDGRYAFADEEQLVALAVTVLRHKVRRTARRAGHPAAAGRTPPAPADQPADVAAARDLLGRLLDTLDGDDRRIVEMRLAEHSTTEIAAALNCTPAVLRARLSRLRRRLRDAGWAGGF